MRRCSAAATGVRPECAQRIPGRVWGGGRPRMPHQKGIQLPLLHALLQQLSRSSGARSFAPAPGSAGSRRGHRGAGSDRGRAVEQRHCRVNEAREVLVVGIVPGRGRLPAIVGEHVLDAHHLVEPNGRGRGRSALADAAPARAGLAGGHDAVLVDPDRAGLQLALEALGGRLRRRPAEAASPKRESLAAGCPRRCRRRGRSASPVRRSPRASPPCRPSRRQAPSGDRSSRPRPGARRRSARAPRASASSTCAATVSRCSAVASGPQSVSGRLGSPTLSASVSSRSAAPAGHRPRHDVDALDRGARLPGVHERRPHQAVRRALDRRVRGDHGGVLAASSSCDGQVARRNAERRDGRPRPSP